MLGQLLANGIKIVEVRKRFAAASQLECNVLVAIATVVNACEGDPRAYFSELAKLCTWSGPDSTLRTADVATLLRPVVGAELPEYLGAVALGRVSTASQRLTRMLAAGVSDGPRARLGVFALATGADTGVRLSDGVAAAPGARKPIELYPYGVYRPRLRAFSFAGALSENLPAGLIKAEDPALIGQIGAPFLSHWRLRFDFPGKRLLLAAP